VKAIVNWNDLLFIDYYYIIILKAIVNWNYLLFIDYYYIIRIIIYYYCESNCKLQWITSQSSIQEL